MGPINAWLTWQGAGDVTVNRVPRPVPLILVK